jgi:hypothetical protein
LLLAANEVELYDLDAPRVVKIGFARIIEGKMSIFSYSE